MTEITQSRAEGYIKLIAELIGQDEEHILKEKFKVALSRFFYGDKTGVLEDGLSSSQDKELERLRRKYVHAEAVGKEEKETKKTWEEAEEKAYALAARKLDPFGFSGKTKNKTVMILQSRCSIVFKCLGIAVSTGLLGLGLFFQGPWILLGTLQFFSVIITLLVNNDFFKKSVSEPETQLRAVRIMEYLVNPETQYKFLVEVFPGVIDDYLGDIGDTTIKELNEKNNELIKLVASINNNRENFVLSDEEVADITEQTKERCNQISHLIVGLNVHISKLEEYKKETLANILEEKETFDKFARTEQVLKRLESIGIDVDEIENRVGNWSTIIDRRLMDYSIEGRDNLNEAKFLLEATASI